MDFILKELENNILREPRWKASLKFGSERGARKLACSLWQTYLFCFFCVQRGALSNQRLVVILAQARKPLALFIYIYIQATAQYYL